METKIFPTLIDISPMTDGAKFQRFHMLTIFWCAYITIAHPEQDPF